MIMTNKSDRLMRRQRLIAVTVGVTGLLFAGSLTAGSSPEAVAWQGNTEAVPAAAGARALEGGGWSGRSQAPPPIGADVAQMVLSPSLSGSVYGDLLAVDQAGTLWRYPSSKTGALRKGNSLGTGWGAVTVYGPGDWDRDGNNDLIAVDQASGKMFLHSGTGKGTVAAKRQIGQGWGGCRVIPAGDLTGDGNVDLLAIKESTGELFLYAGNGQGGFKYPYPKVGNGWKGYDLHAVGDVNRDGYADIMSIDGKGDLFFYAGKGDGTFAKKIQVGNGWRGFTLAGGADLDGDGTADIVGCTPDGWLSFYPAKGGGRFAKKTYIGTC